jgi:RND family efflux transporter MFP subunit
MMTHSKRSSALLALLLAVGVTGTQPDTVAALSADLGQDALGAGPAFIEGLLEPWEDLAVGISVEGVLAEVFVERGQRVLAGDPIARLESSVEEAQVALARATAKMRAGLDAARSRERLAHIRVERIEKLFEQGAVTKEEREQIQTEAELAVLSVREVEEALARAALDLVIAEAMLARRMVRSPIDGIVMERLLSPGELVNRVGSGEIVRIAQAHPLKVDVIAPLSMFGQVHVGQKALVSPEEPIGGIYEATVRVVDPLVDAASGTFRIRIELPNEDIAIPSGVRCRVQFQD